MEAISSRVTLSEGPLCMLSGEGTSLMVHANPDPYTSGPHGSGVSGGPRIVCGIIKKSLITSFFLLINLTVFVTIQAVH